MPTIQPLLLSIEDAARALSLAPQTLRNLMARGQCPFPTVKIGARRLVPAAALQQFVDSLSGASAPAQAPQPDPAPTAPTRRPGRPRLGVKGGAA